MLCLLLESRIRRRRGTVVSAEGIDNRAPMSCTCSYMWSTMAPERVEYVWPYGTHTEREKPRETHSSPPPLPFTNVHLDPWVVHRLDRGRGGAGGVKPQTSEINRPR